MTDISVVPDGALRGHRLCLERIGAWEEYKLAADDNGKRWPHYRAWKYEVLHNLRGWLRAYERTWPCLRAGTCQREAH